MPSAVELALDAEDPKPSALAPVSVALEARPTAVERLPIALD